VKGSLGRDVFDRRVFADQIVGLDLFDVRVVEDRSERGFQSPDVLRFRGDEDVQVLRRTGQAEQIDGRRTENDILTRSRSRASRTFFVESKSTVMLSVLPSKAGNGPRGRSQRRRPRSRGRSHWMIRRIAHDSIPGSPRGRQ
jgi:hypothetical protein